MKRILEYLLKSDTRHTVRLSAGLKSELQRRTKLINSNIPEEFPRKMRSTTDYTKYKAVEFKFLALYAARRVVFQELVSTAVYNHLMLFTVACSLMCYDDPLPHIDSARKYFKQFVNEAVGIYGPSFLSLNVHNLIHLCDDVETTSCNFNELSAFCFESYLGSVSRMLRSPTHIATQYCRRVLEKEKFTKAVSKCDLKIKIMVKKQDVICKLKFNGMVLSTTSPNSTILLKDGNVAEICEFVSQSSGIVVKIKKYAKKVALFQTPCDSGLLNIWEVNNLSTFTTEIPLKKIVQKFVNFHINLSTMESTKNVVVPLLH